MEDVEYLEEYEDVVLPRLSSGDEENSFSDDEYLMENCEDLLSCDPGEGLDDLIADSLPSGEENLQIESPMARSSFNKNQSLDDASISSIIRNDVNFGNEKHTHFESKFEGARIINPPKCTKFMNRISKKSEEGQSTNGASIAERIKAELKQDTVKNLKEKLDKTSTVQNKPIANITPVFRRHPSDLNTEMQTSNSSFIASHFSHLRPKQYLNPKQKRKHLMVSKTFPGNKSNLGLVDLLISDTENDSSSEKSNSTDFDELDLISETFSKRKYPTFDSDDKSIVFDDSYTIVRKDNMNKIGSISACSKVKEKSRTLQTNSGYLDTEKRHKIAAGTSKKLRPINNEGPPNKSKYYKPEMEGYIGEDEDDEQFSFGTKSVTYEARKTITLDNKTNATENDLHMLVENVPSDQKSNGRYSEYSWDNHKTYVDANPKESFESGEIVRELPRGRNANADNFSNKSRDTKHIIEPNHLQDKESFSRSRQRRKKNQGEEPRKTESLENARMLRPTPERCQSYAKRKRFQKLLNIKESPGKYKNKEQASCYIGQTTDFGQNVSIQTGKKDSEGITSDQESITTSETTMKSVGQSARLLEPNENQQPNGNGKQPNINPDTYRLNFACTAGEKDHTGSAEMLKDTINAKKLSKSLPFIKTSDPGVESKKFSQKLGIFCHDQKADGAATNSKECNYGRSSQWPEKYSKSSNGFNEQSTVEAELSDVQISNYTGNELPEMIKEKQGNQNTGYKKCMLSFGRDRHKKKDNFSKSKLRKFIRLSQETSTSEFSLQTNTKDDIVIFNGRIPIVILNEILNESSSLELMKKNRKTTENSDITTKLRTEGLSSTVGVDSRPTQSNFSIKNAHATSAPIKVATSDIKHSLLSSPPLFNTNSILNVAHSSDSFANTTFDELHKNRNRKMNSLQPSETELKLLDIPIIELPSYVTVDMKILTSEEYRSKRVESKSSKPTEATVKKNLPADGKIYDKIDGLLLPLIPDKNTISKDKRVKHIMSFPTISLVAPTIHSFLQHYASMSQQALSLKSPSLPKPEIFSVQLSTQSTNKVLENSSDNSGNSSYLAEPTVNTQLQLSRVCSSNCQNATAKIIDEKNYRNVIVSPKRPRAPIRSKTWFQGVGRRRSTARRASIIFPKNKPTSTKHRIMSKPCINLLTTPPIKVPEVFFINETTERNKKPPCSSTTTSHVSTRQQNEVECILPDLPAIQTTIKSEAEDDNIESIL